MGKYDNHPNRHYWLLLATSASAWFTGGLAAASPVQESSPTMAIATAAQRGQPISTRAADLLIQPTIEPEALSLAPVDARGAIGQADPATETAESSSASEVSQGEQGVRLLPSRNEGANIERVFIYLRNPTGDPAQDEAYRQQIAKTLQIRAGGNFSILFTDLALRQVQQLDFVQAAEYRLYQGNVPGGVILALLVTLQPAKVSQPAGPAKARGILVNGDLRQFPILYESDRALVKTILNAGFGVFSDTNAWFGNPSDFVAGAYQPKGTITWPEFYIEPGLGAITQIGDSPLYVYGAVSYLESTTLAPDIFRSDVRFYGDVEKLYGGLLAAKKGNPVSFNLSAGRQSFQLNRNFLFGQVLGSANALERGASFLNARTVYDNAVLANLRLGNFLIQGFYLDPDELPVSETNSRFLGVNLKYNDNRNLEAALAYVTIPESDSVYVFPDGQRRKREGLQVINPRLRWSNPFGLEGFSLESEYAYEWNRNFAMSANAAYIWVGYTFKQVPWQPRISYRFAGFSGDDPKTSTYGRFDFLRGGGLGDWLQGINLAKVYSNSNVLSHRVELQVNPSSTLQFSLDYFYLFADQLNNLGGRPVLANLESLNIGQEVTLTTRWSVAQNLFLLGITSIAFPGEAIQRAVTEDASPWFTFQVALFLGF
jgi:hypothetical protein